MTATASPVAPSQVTQRWLEDNQAHLIAALATTAAQVARHLGRTGSGPSSDRVPAELTPAPALDVVCDAFGLTPFERAILLLCAGCELDANVAALCAEARGDPGQRSPTFGLSLAALDDSHWSALTPEGPLRRWRLVEASPHGPLTAATLRIDEHVLHFLTGLSGPDPKLTGIAVPASTPAPALDVVCGAFGLTPFERSILLLCAGCELDPNVAALCAGARGDPSQ
ncbi:MAG: hypothetical protein M3537_01150, partial [Chloroflexota bacterium]|nr:hypothetical protein [Chloroflexota bacterium]